MKKKEGFISSAMVYSFLVVFILLLFFIMNSYSNNRKLVGSIKNEVKDNTATKRSLALYIMNTVEKVYDGDGLYLHNNVWDNGANDGNYRYAGKNPNNYVCFGSNSNPCPADNQYRIIGVFDGKVKLIKNGFISNKNWDNNNNFNWDRPSTLNKFLNNKNNGFLSTLGANADKIALVNWESGGVDNANHTPLEIFTLEKKQFTSNSYKIGLMSVSDYGFAALPGTWGYIVGNSALGYNSKATDNDWLFSLSGNIFTITKSNGSPNVFIIDNEGSINGVPAKSQRKIRPVFYLNTDVSFSTGDGTKEKPFVI